MVDESVITVSELIDILKTKDQDAVVCVFGDYSRNIGVDPFVSTHLAIDDVTQRESEYVDLYDNTCFGKIVLLNA
jgi:hypothetical protein